MNFLVLILFASSVVFTAEIQMPGFNSLQNDERFFKLAVSCFFDVTDLSVMCCTSKSLRRLLKKLIINQVIPVYRACFPETRLNRKLLHEFEMIWKIVTNIQECVWFEAVKQRRYLRNEDLEPLPFVPNIFYKSVVFFIAKESHLDFPAITHELLKDGTICMDDFVQKALNQPELYKEALRHLAQEVFKCKRIDLPKYLKKFNTLNLIRYNYRIDKEILIKHSTRAILKLLLLTTCALSVVPFFKEFNGMAIVTIYLLLALRIVYFSRREQKDECGNV